jgi:hypothetical protein
MVLVELPEQGVAVEPELRLYQTEVASWSYYVPSAGVKCYTYDEWALPVEAESPREASLQKARDGSA